MQQQILDFLGDSEQSYTDIVVHIKLPNQIIDEALQKLVVDGLIREREIAIKRTIQVPDKKTGETVDKTTQAREYLFRKTLKQLILECLSDGKEKSWSEIVANFDVISPVTIELQKMVNAGILKHRLEDKNINAVKDWKLSELYYSIRQDVNQQAA